MTTRVASRTFNLVLPASCVFCDDRQEDGRTVCGECYGDLPRYTGSQSPVTPLAAVVAPFEYGFPVDAAIKAMKFNRRLAYAPAFASLLMQSFDEVPEDVDALLPMPLHWLRHAARGFNQAAEIARPLHRQSGLPLVTNVVRHRRTPFQSGLSASQRKRNLAAAFKVKGSIDFAHVLVIDDVITTGETCRQLAGVVLEAGANKVSALAIARAIPG